MNTAKTNEVTVTMGGPLPKINQTYRVVNESDDGSDTTLQGGLEGLGALAPLPTTLLPLLPLLIPSIQSILGISLYVCLVVCVWF